MRWPAASLPGPENLPQEIPGRYATAFKRHNLLNANVAWAVPCISGSSKMLPSNLFGFLVGTQEDLHSLIFLYKRGFATAAISVDLDEYTASQESQFLSENLVLSCGGKKNRLVFLFSRPEAERVSHLVEKINHRFAEPEPSDKEPQEE